MEASPLIPGFGPKSSRALAAVGVASLTALKARNPYQLYGELKARNPRVSLNFLYGILAVHEGRHWRQIKRSSRTAILLRLDELGLAPK